MRFCVLGTLTLLSDDTEVSISRPMSRALLGLLIARANRPISAEQLVEELWVGDPPSSAKTALRVHLTHLRQALSQAAAPVSATVDSSSAGYQLTVAKHRVDALEFERACRTAREAADAGATSEVRELLETALGWWRGPAYQDLTDYSPLAAEATRLEDLRLGAIESLADAHLTLGRPEAACEILTGVAALHPLRESLAERLMLALYRSGRPSDALRAFSRLREALDRELGMEPGSAVRELETAIVVQGRELDLPRGAPRPLRPPVPEDLPVAGRRSELAAIERTWAALSGARPGLVVVTGAAGIGKTTLVETACARFAETGAHVLTGSCDPEPSSDYEPVPQLVRAALKLADLKALRDPIFGELGRLVPEAAGRLPEPAPAADPTTGRHRLFSAVASLFEAIATTPTVIVAEDLQWTGADAFALLRHVLSSCHARILVITTSRDDELAPDAPAVEAMAHGRFAKPDLVVALDGLDIAELGALVRSLSSDQLRERLSGEIDVLRDLTAGNPLFVREVLRELAASPIPLELGTLAPDGVRTLVERRLARLSPIARSTLSVAAVLGREFSVALLAETAELTVAEVLDALDAALESRLVFETDEIDRFAFNDLMVVNTIIATTTASRRARLHLRAGEILVADSKPDTANAAECARHFLAALPLGDVELAAAYALHAGREAAASFAYADAIAWHERALELSESAGWSHHQRASALLELGEALELEGERREAQARYLEAADQARAGGDRELLADAAIAATPRYVLIDEFHPTQRALVDEALDCEGLDPRRLVWLLSCASAGRYYETPADRPYAIRALGLARSSDDPEVRATGLLTYHRWLTHDPASAPERLTLSRELLTLCQTEQLDEMAGRAARTFLIDSLGVGHLDDFDREMETLARYAAEHRAPADIYWVSAFRATRRLMIDPRGEAEELVRAARRLGAELQQGDSEGTFILQSFALRFQQDRTREVTAGLETPTSGQPRILAGLSLLAAALVESGRSDDARKILDRAVVGAEIRLPHDNLWFAATALYAGVAARAGSAEQRTVLTRALEPLANLWCMFGAGGAIFGTGHHWLGRLAVADSDVERAISHFERAAELSTAAGAGYWADVAGTDLDAITAERTA